MPAMVRSPAAAALLVEAESELKRLRPSFLSGDVVMMTGTDCCCCPSGLGLPVSDGEMARDMATDER